MIQSIISLEIVYCLHGFHVMTLTAILAAFTTAGMASVVLFLI